MPVYMINTKISSNVPPSYLLYDLCIYRMDSKRNKHSIIDVKQQALQSNYETQRHPTKDINDALSVLYIMEVVLFRKTLLKTIRDSETPFSRLYTLQELTTGKAFSAIDSENPCYFETTGQTRPVSEGENTKIVRIFVPERPFIAKEYPLGSPFDPFEKKKIEGQIFSRFHHMDYPDQGETSLCGPAAFFYCLQMDRPDIYAQAARELWRYGRTKIGELYITPSEGCRHPKGSFYDSRGSSRVSGLDWMMLAGLRDSGNAMMRYDNVDDKVAGITLWGKLTEWFEKAGYEKVFGNVGFSHINQQGVEILNEYAGKGYRVVTLISDGMLATYPSILPIKNHWVVWSDQVRVTGGLPVVRNTDSNDKVDLRVFSWGDAGVKLKNNYTIRDYCERTFGGLVFKPIS